MQYDQPITGNELNEALDQNPALSEETKALIDQQLGIFANPDTPVNIASTTFDPATGELVTTGPDGTPQMVIIDLSQATEAQVIAFTGALSQAGVYVFDSDVDIAATWNTVERLIVGGNGDDFFTINGDKNTTVDGSNGNDTLVTSGGNDSIIASVGNDSVSTGAGNDTINAGLGNDTIDAGASYDLLTISGAKTSYNVSVSNGNLVIGGADGAVVSNAEFISFGDGGTMTVSGNVAVAATIRLYEALLDRAAEFGGAQFWSESVQNGTWSNTTQTADFFLHSAEFQSKYGNPDDLSDEAFVNILYENVLGRSAEGDGLNYWVDVLATNTLSRPDITVFIAGSPEAVAYTSGTVQFIDGWV